MIGTVTLNPSIDREILVKELVKDDAVRAMRVRDTAGGKGVNVSKVVRELGGKTRAFVLAGGLEGRLYREKISKLDFPYQLIPIAGHTRLNIILTDHDDATQTRISAPGPRVSSAEIGRLMSALVSVRPRPFVWVLGGSLPAGASTGLYDRIMRLLARQTGVPCVLDADGEALRRGVQAKPFLIKPNEFEFERLMGRSFKTIGATARGARQLVRRGIRIVVVSLGAEGAVFAAEEKSFFIPSIRIQVRSKVGAGDSLIAGMLLGLQRGKSLEEAARLGMAASHSAVMREVPRLCLKADIPRLAGRFHIRRAI